VKYFYAHVLGYQKKNEKSNNAGKFIRHVKVDICPCEESYSEWKHKSIYDNCIFWKKMVGAM
jgi:hypothetical protein